MFSKSREYIRKYYFAPKLSILLLLFFNFDSYSQQLTDNQIKAGFIYGFLKYITWENDEKIDTIRIAMYGEDQDMFETLKSMEIRSVKNKPIKILHYLSIGEIISTQVLYISNDRNYFVKDIFNITKGKNILIITDRCEFKRFIMINFVYNNNSKIQFEINTNNIAEANLKANPKMVLLGGSEIDVRKLYLETEQSLKSEKEKSESFEKELLQRKEEINNMSNKLQSLYKEIQNDRNEIEKLQKNITTQKNELNNLLIKTDEQQKNLNQKSAILEKQKKEILQQEFQLKKQKGDIENKVRKIEEYSKILNDQKSEISGRQATIEDQKKTLENQIGKIKTQQTFLYLLISLSIMTFAFLFVLYRNYTINRRKNRELEKMNTELEKLSIVASKTGNAVMIMDEKGELEWINDGFTRMYGYKLNEFISAKGKLLVDASSYENIEKVMEVIHSEKRTVTYETSNTNSDGRKIWVHTTLTPILDEQKEIKKLIAIDSDITQLKEAELDILNKNREIERQSKELYQHSIDLLKLNHELELRKNKLEETINKLKNAQAQLVESEKMVILGQLTSGIAHEINNPINYINAGIDGIGMAFSQVVELLQNYDQITPANVRQKLKDIEKLKQNMDYNNLIPDIHNLTKDIKTGINRTVEIVKELRTFSRTDESDLKLIDIHRNIDSTLVILRNRYINKIDIVKEYGKVSDVECFPGKINQVFLNILVNAIQSIDESGQIVIKTSQMEKDHLQFAVVSISDNGFGMTEEIKRKIFEPFFSTKTSGEGTGLGLSISYNIIENHHGTIEVETEFGKGSTFTIYLPLVYQKKSRNIYAE